MAPSEDPAAPADETERATLKEQTRASMSATAFLANTAGCSSCLALVFAVAAGIAVATFSVVFSGDASPGFQAVFGQEFARLFCAGLVAFCAYLALTTTSRQRRLRRVRERWLAHVLDPASPLPRNEVRFRLRPFDDTEAPDTLCEFAALLHEALSQGDPTSITEFEPEESGCDGSVYMSATVRVDDNSAHPHWLFVTCSIVLDDADCCGGAHGPNPDDMHFAASGTLQLHLDERPGDRGPPPRAAVLTLVERVRRALAASDLVWEQRWHFSMPGSSSNSA